MALLLVYDRDNTHPDKEKDARGCYKRGMVVQCFEDGTPCVEKPNPPWIIVHVPGLSQKDAEEKYMRPETKLVEVQEEKETRLVEETVRRRSMALDLAAVSTKVKKEVDTARVVTLEAEKLPVCEKSLVEEAEEKPLETRK